MRVKATLMLTALLSAIPLLTAPLSPNSMLVHAQTMPGQPEERPMPGPVVPIDPVPAPVVVVSPSPPQPDASTQERLAAVEKTTSALTKLKLSGYIQGRFEYHQDSADIGFNGGTKPAVTNQFLVRRGRLKAAYSGKMAEYLLQIDATGKEVTLKDAEATFIEPWTGLGLRVTMGQFKWPFGFEVLQSSVDREMPERALVIKKLFPGERDRGARLQLKWERVRLSVATVNGNGTSDPLFPGQDNSGYKDLVGRLGFDMDWLTGGLSAYRGKNLSTITVKGNAAATPPTVDHTAFGYFAKNRYGADVQVKIAVPSLGDLAVRGEFIVGEEANADVRGWYAFLRQGLGEKVAAFARLDQYDPNTAKADDATTTVGGGVQYTASHDVKLSGVYEHVTKEGVDKRDDILTLQVQARF